MELSYFPLKDNTSKANTVQGLGGLGSIETNKASPLTYLQEFSVSQRERQTLKGIYSTVFHIVK